MKKFLISAFIIILPVVTVVGQFMESPEEKTERMQWFADARLGIFIHWGIYAVNGID